jgi:hypothetical protein
MRDSATVDTTSDFASVHKNGVVYLAKDVKVETLGKVPAEAT